MGIIAKSNGGDFEQTPSGSFIARCYKMIDIGTQSVTWSEEVKYQHQVYIFWELLEDEDGEAVRMKDGRPFSVSNRYTLSTHPKANMRQHIDLWRGIPFTDEEAEALDITKLLGTYCRVQISHTEKNGKTYTNVAGIGHTKKKPKGENEVSWWSVSDPDLGALEHIPEWLKDKIMSSKEWAQDMTDRKLAEDASKAFHDEPVNLDDIPL